MSADSIARWDAIPLNRPDSPLDKNSNLKRSRADDDQSDGDDDSMSLVSRSPSPTDQMDVDVHLDKYDEYHKGSVREVVTVDTRLKSTNKGFAMLAKMGWVEGQAVGLSGDGRVDPVPFHIKNDLTGLGKTNQDARMIETTVSQRRGLDSERQQKETEEQRIARESVVARKAALQDEISTTLRAFYCSLCDKQFKNVAQYDEHTNSYAHHHKARFRDMQAAQKLMQGVGSKEDVDKRKEKERKREEKELRKLAAAAGVKMPKPVSAMSPGAPLAAVESQAKPSAFKKSGWGTVSSTVETPAASSSTAETRGGTVESPAAGSAGRSSEIPPSSAGWASVTPSQMTSSVATYSSSAPTFNSGGQMSLDSSGVDRPYNPTVPAPAFRTGGWTSLDTGSSHPTPPSASLPPAPGTRGGWATVQSGPSDTPSRGAWNSAAPPMQTHGVLTSGRTPPDDLTHSPSATSEGAKPPIPDIPLSLPASSSVQRPNRPAPEDKRSSWQQFKKKAYR